MSRVTLNYGSIIAAAMVWACLSPAQAQDQAQTQSPSAVATAVPKAIPDPAQRCRALLAALPFSSDPDTARVEQSGGDCLIHNIRFGTGQTGYLVDSLRLHGVTPDLDSLPDVVPDRPEAVRVEARGITFSPQIKDNRKLMWMIAEQQVPFDVTLDASYDPATQRATLNELSMDGESIGHVLLQFTAEAIAPGKATDLFAKGGLTRLHLDMNSRRFLTAFALSPLLEFLPEDDPGGAVDTGKRAVVAGIGALLPQAGASAATVDALTGYVADFPHPKHPFTIDIAAASPVTAETILASASPAQLLALVRTLTITARYTGAFQ